MAVVLVALGALGAGACSNGGGDKAATTTSSTSGPPGPVLQLRAVLPEEPTDCAGLNGDPPPAQPVHVLYANQCIALAPAALAVSKAGVSWEIDNTQALATTIALQGPDVAAMAELSQAQRGSRVAAIAFGKVLTLAAMQQPITDGKVRVSGIAENDARRLKAALS